MDRILLHYYKISTNIDVKDFDEKLVDSLNFYEHQETKLEDYLSENKVLIDSNLFKSYIDLFVVLNFGNKKTYSHEHTSWGKIKSTSYSIRILEDYCYTISDNFISSFLKVLRNTGYIVRASDILYAPFICRMVNSLPELSNNEKINIKAYLYSNIDILSELNILVTKLNDPELNLLSQLMHIEKINKNALTTIFNNANIEPNSSHMAVILNHSPNKQDKYVDTITETKNTANIV